MDSLKILEILELGFIGLAFLLAYFAYRLLVSEQHKNEPDQNRQKLIYVYMGFALILGGMAVVSPYMPEFLEEKPNPYMDYLVESAKNREPLDKEFIEQQIETLVIGHEARLAELAKQRLDIEKEIPNYASRSETASRYLDALDRIERYISDENRAFDRKIRDLKNM